MKTEKKSLKVLGFFLKAFVLALIGFLLYVYSTSFKMFGIEYTLNDDGESYTLSRYGALNIQETFSIPSTYNGLPVTKIGINAFKDAPGRLKKVIISNNVTSVGWGAFDSCYSLSNITIGNSVTSIGDFAFHNCVGISNITIGDSVTEIGLRAFSGCSRLKNVTIGNSVVSIGDEAFSSCSLSNITIGDSVTEIGSSAFSRCESLTSITIGNSVTSIGDYAFYCCNNLTSVTIPTSVTSIGHDMLGLCYSLKNVFYTGTEEDWSKIDIGISNEELKNATRYYYSEDVPPEEGNFWHYGENGVVVIW